MRQFSEIPEFIFDDYLTTISKTVDYETTEVNNIWNSTYCDALNDTCAETFDSDGLIFIQTHQNITDYSTINKSYLMGPSHTVMTNGGNSIEVYIETEEQYQKAKITAEQINVKERSEDWVGAYYNMFINVIKEAIPRLFPYYTLTDESYYFEKYDCFSHTEESSIDLRSNYRIFLRKDSLFFDGVETDEWMNKNQDFTFVGHLYPRQTVKDNSIKIYRFLLFDYVMKSIPPNNRTARLFEFFKTIYDKTYSKIYYKQKDIKSLYTPNDVNKDYFENLSSLYNINISNYTFKKEKNIRDFLRHLPIILKQKGTYNSLINIWKLINGFDITENRDINIYEWWHDTLPIGTYKVADDDWKKYNYLNNYVAEEGTEIVKFGSSGSEFYNKTYTDFYPDFYNSDIDAIVKDSFILKQTEYSKTWEVSHWINSDQLVIQCFDEYFNELYPKNIEIMSTSRIKVEFSRDTIGYCVFCKTSHEKENLGIFWDINHNINKKTLIGQTFTKTKANFIPKSIYNVSSLNTEVEVGSNSGYSSILTSDYIFYNVKAENYVFQEPEWDYLIGEMENGNLSYPIEKFKSGELDKIIKALEDNSINFYLKEKDQTVLIRPDLEQLKNTSYTSFKYIIKNMINEDTKFLMKKIDSDLTPKEIEDYENSKTWTISHNLNVLFLVQVYNLNDVVIVPSDIRQIDFNTMEIEFAEPTNGYAVLKTIGKPIDNQLVHGNILSPHYSILADISGKPVDTDVIFSKTTADNLHENWENFRPANRVSHYGLVFSPKTDFSGSMTNIYDIDYGPSWYSVFVLGILYKNITSFRQLTSNTTWKVSHSLKTSQVLVICYDEEYNEIVPYEITISSSSEVIIDFDENATGYVFVIPSEFSKYIGYNIETSFSHSYGKNLISQCFSTFEDNLIIPETIKNEENMVTISATEGGYFYSVEGTIIYKQSVNESIWNIEHNLDSIGLISQYFDHNWEKIYPDNVNLVDNNTCLTTFSEPVSGHCLLKPLGNLNDKKDITTQILTNGCYVEIGDADSVNFIKNNTKNIDHLQSSVYDKFINTSNVYTEGTDLFVDILIDENIELDIREIGIYDSTHTTLYFYSCGHQIYKTKDYAITIHFKILYDEI